MERFPADVRADMLRVCAQYGARKVRLFGSMARGDAGASSDVDILVDFEPSRSLLDRVALTQDLEDLLGRKVQVVTEKALHWYIRDRILDQAVPL